MLMEPLQSPCLSKCCSMYEISIGGFCACCVNVSFSVISPSTDVSCAAAAEAPALVAMLDAAHAEMVESSMQAAAEALAAQVRAGGLLDPCVRCGPERKDC